MSESLRELTLRGAILNMKLAWDSLDEEVIDKCWHNKFTVGIDEDNIPLIVLRDQFRSERLMNEALASEFTDLFLGSDVLFITNSIN